MYIVSSSMNSTWQYWVWSTGMANENCVKCQEYTLGTDHMASKQRKFFIFPARSMVLINQTTLMPKSPAPDANIDFIVHTCLSMPCAHSSEPNTVRVIRS